MAGSIELLLLACSVRCVAGTVLPFPLSLFQEVDKLLVVIISSIALVVLWVYRRRVIFALTGDDRFHASWYDVVWYGGFKCCCLCDGEWTVLCSNWCCPCAPWLQAKNLKKELAKYLGILPKTVVFRNVVVGDLPYNQSHGDFYVTFDCGDNPPMNSSLSDGHTAKLVHFHESFSIRMRDSYFEAPLTITVRELNVVGSEDIARVVLPMQKYWKKYLRAGQRVQSRFKLEPVGEHDRAGEAGMFPWILLEFEVEGERQLVDHIGLLTTGAGGAATTTPVRMQDLKKDYALRDKTGHRVFPDGREEDLSSVRKKFRRFWRCMQLLTVLLVTAVILGLGSYRLLVRQCWKEYARIATAERYGIDEFPLSHQVWKQEMPTWNFDATTDEDVLQWCDEPPIVNNATYRPRVAEHFISYYLRDVITAPHCYPWTCHHRQFLVRIPLVSLALVLSMCLCCFVFCCAPDPPTRMPKHRRTLCCGEDDDDDDDLRPRNQQEKSPLLSDT
mmetsp:Transcript_39569/g.93182  ORF Transcript_39569/g.93182 Transcript_39569/m.93182 type:complete len:501 (-) Transcript_39569:248-1750(-)